MLHVILRLSDEVRFLDSGGVYRTPDTGGSRSEIPAPAGKDLNRHARNQRSACEHLAAPPLLIVIPTGAGPAFSHARLCERRFTPRNEGPRSGGIVATSLTATQPRHLFVLARPLPFFSENQKPTTNN